MASAEPEAGGNPSEPESLAPALPELPEEAAAAKHEVVLEAENLHERIDALEDALRGMQQRLSVAERRMSLAERLTFHGFVDFGFFQPQGDGSGWRQDFANQAFPRYAGQYGWVFYGDILAPMVNTRGEAADLGDAPGADRFDSIDSGGAPGFVVSEVNTRLSFALARSVILTTSVNFVPRTGSEFSLGDFIELDIAQLEWIVDEDQTTSIFAGKIESVIGVEYKERRADRRFGITPSLIQRYTSGPQLGLKVRSRLFSDWLIVAAAVTNGSSTVEPFHFYNEIDTNAGKTVSGRVALRAPLDALGSLFDGHRLEVGVSGELGAQDRATGVDGKTWFAGVDLEYLSTDLSVKGMLLIGASDGDPAQNVWSLDLDLGGYLEVDYNVWGPIGVLGRFGFRDAFVALGDERAYVTRSWRVTAGLRAVISHHIVLKAEYLLNGEYGGVPKIENDVITSSLVLRY